MREYVYFFIDAQELEAGGENFEIVKKIDFQFGIPLDLVQGNSLGIGSV